MKCPYFKYNGTITESGWCELTDCDCMENDNENYECCEAFINEEGIEIEEDEEDNEKYEEDPI
jgi:hypothetical protein